MELKTCSLCAAPKALSEFHRNPKTKDGRQGRCKLCACAVQQARYAARADEERKAAIERLARAKENGAAYFQRQDAETRRARAARMKEYRQRNPDKEAARRIAREAIRTGVLKVSPCKVCGDGIGVHAHHESYAKPLDVVWLCQRHHGERHREINEERRRTG